MDGSDKSSNDNGSSGKGGSSDGIKGNGDGRVLSAGREDVWLMKFKARHGMGKESTGTTLVGISGMGGKGVWAGDEGAGWA